MVHGGMLEETILSKNNFLFSFIPELSEDWSSVREPVIDGVPFYAKYLGSSLVQKPSGEEATSEAIKTIIAMASFFFLKKNYEFPHLEYRKLLFFLSDLDAGP